MKPKLWDVFLFVLLLLVLYVFLTNRAHASGWDVIKQATDGSYYTSIDSVEVPEAALILYAAPDEGCVITMHLQVMFDGHRKEGDLSGEIHTEYRVDKNEIRKGDAVMTMTNQTYSGNPYTVLRIAIRPDQEFLDQLEKGKRIITRSSNGKNGYTTTLAFGLKGTNYRVPQLLAACNKDAWEDTSTFKRPDYNGDEWTL